MVEIRGFLSVRVVTPEGSLFEGDARFIAAPALDGEMGILPSHTAIVAALGTGELRIEHGTLGGEVTEHFAVRGGILQVVENRVTLLVTEAVRPGQVDEEKVAEDREEVLSALTHPGSEEEFETLLERRRWADVRDKVAGKEEQA